MQNLFFLEKSVKTHLTRPNHSPSAQSRIDTLMISSDKLRVSDGMTCARLRVHVMKKLLKNPCGTENQSLVFFRT